MSSQVTKKVIPTGPVKRTIVRAPSSELVVGAQPRANLSLTPGRCRHLRLDDAIIGANGERAAIVSVDAMFSYRISALRKKLLK
jgi:hypothetical protein